MGKEFHERVWIGDDFLDPDDETHKSELLPDNYSDDGMVESDGDDKIIEAQVTLRAKAKLAAEPLQKLMKRRQYFCPVCKRAGKTHDFRERTAFLQHLRSFGTFLVHHHRGYYKAFEEVFKEGEHRTPSAGPPMKTELLKRQESVVLWPPVLVVLVKDATCEPKIDELLKDKRTVRKVMQPNYNAMFLVEFEHSVAGYDQMTALHHFLSIRNMGLADYNEAHKYTDGDPFCGSTVPLFGWAATEAHMKKYDPDRQLIPDWGMQLYSEAVTARIAAMKKKREMEKAEELTVKQDMEDVMKQLKNAEEILRTMHINQEETATRMEAKHISEMRKMAEAWAAEESRLEMIKYMRWQAHGDKLKSMISEDLHVGSRVDEDDEADMKRMEEELIAEEMKRCTEEMLEANRIAAESRAAFEAREGQRTLEILRERKEETERLIKEKEEQQRAFEIKRQEEIDKEVEEQQNEIQKVMDELSDMKDDLESTQHLAGTLTLKQRQTVDKITTLKDACLKVWLDTKGRGRGEKDENVCGNVYVKSAGSLDDVQGLWKAEYKKRVKGEDWEIDFLTRFSEMEDALRDMNWQPYKREGAKMIVDKSDAKLMELGAELGEEVKESMVAALLLMEKYNASGRFPMNVFWHAKKDVEASWEEIFHGLTQLKKKPAKKAKKK